MEETEFVPKKHTRKHIPFSDLRVIIKTGNLRSLQSTEGFPPPVYTKNGECYYSVERVCEFFGVEDLNEPFLTSPQAAEMYGYSHLSFNAMVLKGKIPHYRRKSAKGSGYFFRKSELDKFFSYLPNTDVINNFFITKDIHHLFLYFIECQQVLLTEREKDVLIKVLIDGKNMADIGREFDLCRERVRMIYKKAYDRVRKSILMLYEIDFDAIIQENMQLREENKLLKDTIAVKHQYETGNSSHHPLQVKQTEEEQKKAEDDKIVQSIYTFISYLNRPIKEEIQKWDVSVRAYTVTASLKYIWELFYLYYKPISAKSKLNGILHLRNCGKFTFHELEDVVLAATKKHAPTVNMHEFFYEAIGAPYRNLLTGFDK